MNKCRLCQQITNNLTKVDNDYFKSLAQIILKLKGYKDFLEVNKSLALCDICQKGIENFAIFWKNIPEAKTEIAVQETNLVNEIEQNLAVYSNSEFCVIPKEDSSIITSTIHEQNEYGCDNFGTAREPIKIKIKLPRKRKRSNKSLSSVSTEELVTEKRKRCPPKRYEDYNIQSAKKLQNNENAVYYNSFQSVPLENLAPVALLRLNNNNECIGKLVELERNGVASRVRILCQLCSNVFHLEREFQKHLETHNLTQFCGDEVSMKTYLYYCKLCNKSFHEHYAVRRHYRLVHSEERPLKCIECGVSFKYKFNLDYHMAKHVPKKRFECDFCKKLFLMRYELQIHLRTHTKEKPFKCEFCPLAFAHKSNLKTHIKVKHLEGSTNQTSLKDSINIEEKCKENLFNPPPNLIEQVQINLKNEDELNLKYSGTFEEFSEDLKDEKTEKCLKLIAEPDSIQNVLYNKNVSDLTFSESLEDCSIDFIAKNNEILLPDIENISQNIAEHKSETNNDNTISEISDTSESYKERFDTAYSKFRTFRLDSSILQMLPSSASLLGLKKWPKYFQSASIPQIEPIKNSTENLNPIQKDKFTSHVSENYMCNALIEKADEFPILDMDNRSYFEDNIKSIAKFDLIQTSVDEKSALNTIITKNINNNDDFSNLNMSSSKNLNVSYDFSNLNQYNEKFKTSNSKSLLKINAIKTKDLKTPNTEVPSGKFINIAKLSTSTSTGLGFRKIRIDKNDKTKKTISNTQSLNDHLENNSSQSWNTIKVSQRPVKLKNILYLNKLGTNSTIINYKSKNINITKVQKNPQHSKNESAVFANINTPENRSELPSKSSNMSIQSLLKPGSKSLPITTVSLTIPTNSQSNLSDKPLITKIEIIPPLNTISTLQNSFLSKATTNLIKPPSEYQYQCPHCYKYFKQKSPLTKHLRTHTDEKPYKCNLCPKSFADASNYKKHRILHKNAAEALNIRTSSSAVPNSPAYSSVSDPDPDGVEAMQTLKKFECSTEEDDVDDDASLTSSTMESCMWQDALEDALMNDEIRETFKRNFAGLNNTIMPKSIQQIKAKPNFNLVNINNTFSSEDPD